MDSGPFSTDEHDRRHMTCLIFFRYQTKKNLITVNDVIK